MLKQRVITALLIVPTVLCFIFFLSNSAFALVMGVMLMVGAWEWSNFMKLEHLGARLAYVALMAFLFWLGASWSLVWVLSVALVFWAVALYWVVSYPRKQKQWVAQPILGLVGLLVLYPGWLALVHLHSIPNFGAWVLLYVIGLVAAADIGAYFAGKRFGKKKLAPDVSPGKSVAGLVGGFIAATVLALIVSRLYGTAGMNFWLFIVISQLTALISVLGDLMESMIKRQRGVKDSGTILPGHGGILDRVDGYTAGMPLFSMGYFLFGVSF